MDDPVPSTSKDRDECENNVERLSRSVSEGDLDDEIDKDIDTALEAATESKSGDAEQEDVNDSDSEGDAPNENIHEDNLWDVMAAQDNPFVQPPGIIDFNQLDDALQNVQGHMDSMMSNLGGLQTSVKHLKQNLSNFVRSSEIERSALKNGLHSDIVAAWREGHFTDLTLIDDEGLRHPVHKVVLSSRSSYFRAQLTNWDVGSSELRVSIVPSSVLSIVIEFIYTLDVQKKINASNVVDLLQAANIYDLRLLRGECVLFLKQRISTANILEVLSFAHVDHSLELHSVNFLARNFSRLLAGKKKDLMEVQVDKMLMVLRSKLLILRDKHMIPIRALTREGLLLKFVLEFLKHDLGSRMPQAGELISSVKCHLLPMDPSLTFGTGRYLPDCVLELLDIKEHSEHVASLAEVLEQIEKDVKFLYVDSAPEDLYSSCYSNLGLGGWDSHTNSLHLGLTYNKFSRGQKEVTVMNDRNPGWDSRCMREASLCHEWWTCHAHDSRFIPAANSGNTKIVAVSGSGDGTKCIRKLVFHVGSVQDNQELLPEWFYLGPNVGIQNMQQELGEYIGALYVAWSDGSENQLGSPEPGFSQHTVCLEEGEHIVTTYQLCWSPKQVFVPLEVVDFVFVSSRGRRWGPFTHQVKKMCREAKQEGRMDWSFTDIRHKLNSKSICRKVDAPYSPICKPASITELCLSPAPTNPDDHSWSLWLDGFLGVLKNGKISRLTLKFSIYLDCLYQEGRKPKKGSVEPPALLRFSLEQLRQNCEGQPRRIKDYDTLWDNIMAPYRCEVEDKPPKPKKAKYGKRDENRRVINLNLVDRENNEVEEGNVEAVDISNEIRSIFEGAEQMGAVEENDEGEHLSEDVFDALVNDDHRVWGLHTERRAVNIEDYLE